MKRRKQWLGILLLFAMLSCSGCAIGDVKIFVTADSTRGQLFKIGSSACSMEEAKVYLANYRNIYGVSEQVDLWKALEDTKQNSTGIAQMEQSIKDVTVEQLSKIYTLNCYAKEHGIELTKEEEEIAKEAAKEYEGTLSAREKTYLRVSKKELTKIYENYILARKVNQELMKDVDEEVSEDDARIMDAFVLYAKEKSTMDKVIAEHNGGTKFERLANTYNEEGSARTSFGRGTYPKEVEDAAFLLEEKEITDPIPGNDGYYMIQCINKYNEELSEQNKNNIIKKRQEEAVENIQKELTEEKYSHFNQKQWDKVSIADKDYLKTDCFFSIIEKKLTK